MPIAQVPTMSTVVISLEEGRLARLPVSASWHISEAYLH